MSNLMIVLFFNLISYLITILLMCCHSMLMFIGLTVFFVDLHFCRYCRHPR